MNNKLLLRHYDQSLNKLKKRSTMENKEEYLIIFRELDNKLTKELDSKIEALDYTADTIGDEIDRIDTILGLLKERKNYRINMVNDYTRAIGYEPYNLDELEALDREQEYISYKLNLIIANEVIKDLIKSRDKANTLKKLSTKKNGSKYESELEKLNQDRALKIDTLKSNEGVFKALYNFSINAPLNDENAFIQYIMIKIYPKEALKINVQRKSTGDVFVNNKVSISELEGKRPENIYSNMEELLEEFDDISIPTNGLFKNDNVVKLNISEIK